MSISAPSTTDGASTQIFSGIGELVSVSVQPSEFGREGRHGCCVLLRAVGYFVSQAGGVSCSRPHPPRAESIPTLVSTYIDIVTSDSCINFNFPCRCSEHHLPHAYFSRCRGSGVESRTARPPPTPHNTCYAPAHRQPIPLPVARGDG